MSKLFLFGIGGSGARVIKSLVMLMAAGVDLKCDEVVPIIIDPDKAGADLNRTLELIDNYRRVNKSLKDSDEKDFFKTKISSLNEVISRLGNETNVLDGFRFELDGVQNDKFKEFIDFDTLDLANKDLTSLLFSEENLNAELEVGFKGNPNIGSVVLNQFAKSKEFESFARNFDDGDRIFIVSSIFGGTGAAGFPLLVKNMREGQINGEHFEFLINSNIGALTILPYFKVAADEDSEIDSKGFITKTKAALHYYFRNLNHGKTLNYLYYIGDSQSSEYENHQGGKEQKNNAHFVELASALAVVDFTFSKANNHQTEYKEFGIKSDGNSNEVSFANLAIKTNEILREPLTKFFLFDLFVKQKLRQELNHPYASGYSNKIDSNFLSSNFFKSFQSFGESFGCWIAEMDQNKISFSPFGIKSKSQGNDVVGYEPESNNIFSLLRGVKEKKGIWPFSVNNYELFIAQLNHAAKNTKDSDVNKRFVGIFSKATSELIKKKLF
jgi:hypothetical protein